jgi:hypothetical protein
MEEYPAIHRKNNKIIAAVFTSYFCQHVFSCLTSIDSDDKNRFILAGDELHVCLPKVRSRIKYL